MAHPPRACSWWFQSARGCVPHQRGHPPKDRSVSSWTSLSCAGNHSSGFALTGSMAAQRRLHTATVLTDGSVLIAGGRNDTNPIHACGPSQNCVILGSAEIDNPLTKGFSGTGSLNNNRAGHTATRLNDGTVLVTGGSN